MTTDPLAAMATLAKAMGGAAAIYLVDADSTDGPTWVAQIYLPGKRETITRHGSTAAEALAELSAAAAEHTRSRLARLNERRAQLDRELAEIMAENPEVSIGDWESQSTPADTTEATR